jgi:hypothetical protein
MYQRMKFTIRKAVTTFSLAATPHMPLRPCYLIKSMTEIGGAAVWSNLSVLTNGSTTTKTAIKLSDILEKNMSQRNINDNLLKINRHSCLVGC